MTQIEIISGEILNIIDKRKGIVNFCELQQGLNEPDHLILMALGWLLKKGHIQIIGDTSSVGRWENFFEEVHQRPVLALSSANRLTGMMEKDAMKMAEYIMSTAVNIQALLKVSGRTITLKDIKDKLDESGDVVLMAAGWLMCEGLLHPNVSLELVGN